MGAELGNFYTLARGPLAALDAARRSEVAVELRTGGPSALPERARARARRPFVARPRPGQEAFFGARGAGAGGAIAMVDINLRISGLAPDELAKMGMAEASGR